jgi:hypothetical protein
MVVLTRSKTGLHSEVPYFSPGLDKGFLHDIFGCTFVTGEPPGQTEHRVAVVQHQLAESQPVPGHGLPDYFLFFGLHDKSIDGGARGLVSKRMRYMHTSCLTHAFLRIYLYYASK